MNIVAYLSPDHITLDLIEKIGKKSFSKTIDLLLDYSILTTLGKHLKIHRLTQAVMRLIHKKNNLFDKNFEIVTGWLLPQLEYD